MCGCAGDINNLDRCKAIAALLDRAGVVRIRHVGGNVFHMFFAWYGLPAPVVWLWPLAKWLVAANISATGDPLEVRDLPRRIDFNVGCGCIKALKDGVTWAHRRVIS